MFLNGDVLIVIYKDKKLITVATTIYKIDRSYSHTALPLMELYSPGFIQFLTLGSQIPEFQNDFKLLCQLSSIPPGQKSPLEMVASLSHVTKETVTHLNQESLPESIREQLHLSTTPLTQSLPTSHLPKQKQCMPRSKENEDRHKFVISYIQQNSAKLQITTGTRQKVLPLKDMKTLATQLSIPLPAKPTTDEAITTIYNHLRTTNTSNLTSEQTQEIDTEKDTTTEAETEKDHNTEETEKETENETETQRQQTNQEKEKKVPEEISEEWKSLIPTTDQL